MGELHAEGKIDPGYPEIALKTQAILDACRKSDAADGTMVAL